MAGCPNWLTSPLSILQCKGFSLCYFFLLHSLYILYMKAIFCLQWGITIVDVSILMVRSLTCSDIIDTRETPLQSLRRTVFGLPDRLFLISMYFIDRECIIQFNSTLFQHLVMFLANVTVTVFFDQGVFRPYYFSTIS